MDGLASKSYGTVTKASKTKNWQPHWSKEMVLGPKKKIKTELEQPDLAKDVLTHCRQVGLDDL